MTLGFRVRVLVVADGMWAGVLVPVPAAVVNADVIGAGGWSAGAGCYLGCDARLGVSVNYIR